MRASANVLKLVQSTGKRARELKEKQLTGLVTFQGETATSWEGGSYGFKVPLMNNDDACSVAEIFIPAGSEFPGHSHPFEVEIFVVLRGELTLQIDDEESKTWSKGEFGKVDAEEFHTTSAAVDTWVLAIGVPPIDGYPGVD